VRQFHSSMFRSHNGSGHGHRVAVGIDLQTVICQAPSESRESASAAKLKLPADASLTIWRRQRHPAVERYELCTSKRKSGRAALAPAGCGARGFDRCAGNLGNEATLQAVIEQILRRWPDGQLLCFCTAGSQIEQIGAGRRHGPQLGACGMIFC